MTLAGKWETAVRTVDEGRTYGKILLIGKDEKDGISQLVLVEHSLQFFAGLDDTVAIVAVDDKDDALGVLEVVPPQRTDLVLTADVPNGELDVLVLDGLDVEAWDGVSVARRDGATGDEAIPMVGMVVTISPSLSL